MKKTTRLTALLLALVLLLGTLSASATETTGGIPIDAFNIENYSTIKTIAEENAAAANSGENTVSGAELDAMVEACGDHVLCEHVTAMLELATAQERYDYLISLYVETVPDEVADNALYYDVFDLNYYMLEYVMMHYYECHLTEEEQQASMEGDFSSFAVCACSFPFLEPEYQPGELNVHEDGCPWEFENLSVTEQYQKIRLLSMDARAPYMATLTADQATELETYTARQEGTLSYPCDEMPEYCRFSEYSQLTASELYDYFNDIYADENGEISELYAALMLHYGEYHLDSNLICTCGEHPLLLPDYEVGDISKHEETCPWHFANLTVPEQYDVICLLSAEEQPAYYAVLRPEQETALKDFIASMLGEENCEYADVVAMSGEARYAYMKNLYETTLDSEGMQSWEYVALYSHLANEHASEGLVCNCPEFDIADAAYAYGSWQHNGRDLDDGSHAECPWCFDQLTVEEQYRVLMAVHPDDWNNYTVKLSQAQLSALNAYIDSMQGNAPIEPDKEADKEVNVEGTTADISIPAGTFEKPYIMNTSEAVISEAEQAALNELGEVNMIAAFDISFTDAEDSSVKLQPIDGKTVELTFTVETSKISGNVIMVYHLKANGDGTYTAEPMKASVVDKTKDVQTIIVYASDFSPWVVAESSCDGSDCYTNSETHTVISIQTLQNQNPLQRYATLISLYDEGTTLETLLWHFAFEHMDKVPELLCGCTGAEYMMYAPGSSMHEEGCAWSQAVLEENEEEVPTGKMLYDAYAGLDVVHKAFFMACLDESQKAAMEAYMDGPSVEDLGFNDVKDIEYLSDPSVFAWINELKGTENDFMVWLKTDEISGWRSEKTPAAETMVLAKKTLQNNPGLELEQAMAINRNDELMWLYEDEAMADITETGYIVDIETGIAVGQYDRENEVFIMGTGSN